MRLIPSVALSFVVGFVLPAAPVLLFASPAAALVVQAPAAPAPPARAAEAEVVAYLQAHVVAGQPLVVSDLYNNVFTAAAQRAALNRLFNTFFKIPLFVAQYQKAAGKPPSLKEIGEQFQFGIAGETALMLRIMESDPRLPKFLERDAASGEIRRVDVDAILASPQFGKSLERTITGFEGREAPAFEIESWDGAKLSSASLAGKPQLLYFWFTNCPPCLRTSPIVAALDKEFRAQGLQVVGVNADRVLELPYDDSVRRAYRDKIGATYVQAHLSEEMQEAYGSVSVFPTLFVVDARGIVTKQFVNAPTREAVAGAVRQAMGRAGS
jgi:thiol-disulfide isomerase/thioredoxin